MEKRHTLYIARTAILLALVIVLQFIGLQYLGFLGIGKVLVVGTIVNFILFFATRVVGVFSALLIGLLTPVMALALGHAPVVVTMPFVMIGNITLVLVYFFMLKINNKIWFEGIAICAAALLKFTAMYISVLYILPHLPGITAPMIKAMQIQWSWPQLVTALMGGGLCLIMYQALKKKIKI